MLDRNTVIRLAREAVNSGDGSELSGDAIERFAQLVFLAAADPSWKPMATAPKHQGAQVLAWFPKVKLDDDDNPTTEVIGGAMAQIERQGDGWTEPEWLSAHGSYYFEDWCFADEPVLWHPLPPEPVGPVGVRASDGGTNGTHTPPNSGKDGR